MVVSQNVEIRPAYSPKPHKYRMFDVKCYHHQFRTTVTATPGVVRDWIFKMRRRHTYHIRSRKLMVGIWVQWVASYRYIPAYTNRPADTLQLSVGHECLIFQLTRALRAPRSLLHLLEDPEITRVGVNNHRDVAKLESTHLGFCVGEVVDLVRVASDEGICSNKVAVSMEVLVERNLGMEGINKPEEVALSDWEADVLSEDQVEYACLDASLSFLMGKALQAWDWTP